VPKFLSFVRYAPNFREVFELQYRPLVWDSVGGEAPRDQAAQRLLQIWAALLRNAACWETVQRLLSGPFLQKFDTIVTKRCCAATLHKQKRQIR
jgi:hypothetical protein